MRAVATVALPAMLLWLSACTTKSAETAPNLAMPVTVAKAVQKTIPINLTAIGTAEAYSTVSIKSQVNAILDEVHFKQGDFVKKGDLLFTLDARPFQSALAQARSKSWRATRRRPNSTKCRPRGTKSYTTRASPRKNNTTR